MQRKHENFLINQTIKAQMQMKYFHLRLSSIEFQELLETKTTTTMSMKKEKYWKQSSRFASLIVASSGLSFRFNFLPSQLFHCLSAIIAARLCANKQFLIIVCKQMIPRVRRVSTDVEAVGKLAGKALRSDSIAMNELVLLEGVSGM